MGIIESLMERRASLAEPSNWLINAFGGAATDSGVNVNEAIALQYSAVYACVRVLAESVASLPLPLCRQLTPRGKARAPDHAVYALLHDRPNPEMTSFTFREALMSHLVLWGNAYAEIERDRANRIIGLWPLLPDRTWPERKDRVLTYYTEVTIGGSTRKFALAPAQVLHIPGLGFNGLKGYSPIGMHKQAIGLGLAAEEFGARFFGSGARPSGVIEMDGRFRDKEERDAFREQFSSVYAGLGNALRTAILEQGMKWKQVAIPLNDAQFIETRNFQLREVARIFGVPAHMIGDMERATFSNIEHQALEYVIYTLRPWLVRWEQAINYKLLSPSERPQLFAKFVIEGLLRGDIKARYEAYATGRQNGWLSANDVRELEDMNPLPDDQGDIFMVPLNMIPASQLAESPTPADADELAFPRALPEGSEERDRALASHRSLVSRRRTQRAYQPLLQGAVMRAVRREVEAGRRALREAYGERTGEAQFTDWIDTFYSDEHQAYIRRQLQPVLSSMASAVTAEAAGEVGGEADVTPEIEEFVGGYANTVATRMVASAAGQLRKIIRDTPSEEAAGVLDQRLTEWNETRPAKIANRESVQAGSAIAKAVWTANGVRRLVWRTQGDNCPLCGDLDGKIVEITRDFLSPGDKLDPGGVAPLEVTENFGHPPAHEGCQCGIAPA